MLAFLVVAVAAHLWGTKTNRRIAKKWISALSPTLEKEFAIVGYGGLPKPKTADDVEKSGLLNADELIDTSQLIEEKALNEFTTYATGRQNIAFVNIQLTLHKRYNPLVLAGENIVGFIFESMPAPKEKTVATIYPFDGRETELVPVPGGKVGQDILETRTRGGGSTYDNFVWAVVNKEGMKQLRDDRYDVSLTTTKDNSKLPIWATVMSESAEITDALLTPELTKALEEIGEYFDYLIISDQSIDKPSK